MLHPTSFRQPAASGSLLDNHAFVVRVLDVDARLASAIADGEREAATRAAWAPSVSLGEGPYDFFPPADPGSLGALILDGVITCRLAVGDLGHIEILTPGDVLSPWVRLDGDLVSAPDVTATVVAPTELAVLDRRFAERTARWPELMSAIFHRLVERSRRLSFQAAVNALPRADDRLELTLWQIAERIGHVTSRGIAVGLPITHAELGELIGARRPSVTTGLRRLTESGRVVRMGRHSWLLRGDPPEALEPLTRAAGLPSH